VSRRRWILAAGTLLVAAIAVVAGIGLTTGGPSSAAATPSAVPGTIVRGVGGQWTNVTPDTLATMLRAKDFTLLNVKTPYIGEIDGTDLYIPYTDLERRRAEVPADRAARIVVYCRSGNESAIAAQTLLDLGYTNIVNLDGGMEGWVSSGRALVQKDRS
jgi:rhodanese-related sulfurtransferase